MGHQVGKHCLVLPLTPARAYTLYCTFALSGIGMRLGKNNPSFKCSNGDYAGYHRMYDADPNAKCKGFDTANGTFAAQKGVIKTSRETRAGDYRSINVRHTRVVVPLNLMPMFTVASTGLIRLYSALTLTYLFSPYAAQCGGSWNYRHQPWKKSLISSFVIGESGHIHNRVWITPIFDRSSVARFGRRSRVFLFVPPSVRLGAN